MAEPVPEARKTQRTLVLGAIITSTFMVAIESTIVSTAMPSIVGDLGGFSLYSWVFSAFLLMQAVTTPICGKLSDLFGRKPVFVIGTVIFLSGSLLCGMSTSMLSLIIFRLVQGLGAGAVQPVGATILGDMYTMQERAKIQGYFSSVFGISSVVGPLVGGLIVEYAHWSWIFWMNIPIGILSVIGMILFLHEGIEKQKRSIDYAGAGLFFVSILSMMIVLIQGGAAWSWSSVQIILLLLVFAVSAVSFLVVEQRTREPMMPLGIWKTRLIAAANAATLTSGALVIGLTSFLPAYIQGVMGKSAVIAGFTLTVMTVGWPIAAFAASHLVIRFGVRRTAIAGGIAILVGSLFFITLNPAMGPVWAGVGSFVIGVGMGLTSLSFIISIQNSVSWQMRGVATASNMFTRMLGSSIGAALLGGILNSRLTVFLSSKSNSLGKGISVNSVDQILNSTSLHRMSPAELHILQAGLTVALHSVYWGIFALAVLTVVGTVFLPKMELGQAGSTTHPG